jgi:DNA helicase-2/ATP-dependent DNA helicase PcrA
VPRLIPGAGREKRGRVECALFNTVEDEAERIATRVAHLLAGDPAIAPDGAASEGEPLAYSDVAVLARKRSQFPLIRKALESRGIPVEVVGLGGLLTVPEVQDVVATLRVMHDPTAGASLARLLTGPRWRLGPRDLVALGRRARTLAQEATRDITPPADAPSADSADSADSGESGESADGDAPADLPDDPLRQLVSELNQETGSLVDALDDLGPPEQYSPEGHARLRRLRDELRGLRRQVGLPLPDLVTEVERALGLDIEVAARAGLDPVTARADLDAFIDAAATFAGDAEDPTLGAFLAYLQAAETEEFGLEAGRVGESNSVKLLTVHASKGLEWPVVIVPGLSYTPQKSGGPAKGSIFPSPPQNATRWTANPRVLPFPLRGDRADLPVLRGLEKDDLAAFDRACAERDLREERRLAYVAVTRASSLLIATGYWWGSSGRPLGPSPFLEEIREVCVAGAGTVAVWAPPPEEGAANPLLEQREEAAWPVSPAERAARGDPTARERYDAIVEGARMVDDAMTGRTLHWAGNAGLTPADRSRMTAWARDVELLLAERDRGRGGDGLQVELPAHLSVSSLVSLARDPAALARQIRRPMPRPPAPYARRGTAFHAWLESRWGQQRLIDPDELPGAADEGAADDDFLDRLQERFEESIWAAREPIDIEVPFETVIGDRLVRGRMDAVFRSGDGYEVVDWKTGKPPSGADADAAAVQLAAYRLAWAELADVPVERVSAAFHYVSANRTVRPADLLDADGLAALLEGVPVIGA